MLLFFCLINCSNINDDDTIIGIDSINDDTNADKNIIIKIFILADYIQ